jgi:hypothetical protein
MSIHIGKIDDTWIDSVPSFVSAIAQFERRHIAQWFFRGHTKAEYELVPGLYRLNRVRDESFASWEDLEKFLLLAFQREAAQYIEGQSLSFEDWICLAQHHRLPTRLLDWTTNSLIALFFAVESNYETEANVWCMGFPSTNNCMPEGTFFSQRKSLLDSNFILFPRHIDERIINQGGCFTKHDSEVPLNKREEFGGLLTFNRFRIAPKHKKEIRAALYDMGIHVSFIYPSLDSLASRLHYELTEVHARHTLLP